MKTTSVDKQTKPEFLIGVFIAALVFSNIAFWGPWFFDVIKGIFSQTPNLENVNRDFVNYWFSGRLVLTGEYIDLFSQPDYQKKLQGAFNLGVLELRSWSYPPHFLLVTTPLGLLPYLAAYGIYQLMSLALFSYSIRMAILNSEISLNRDTNLIIIIFAFFLSPFVILQIAAGQNGLFFGSIMIIALAARNTNKILAGIALGLLTMKPQLGLLFPVLLLIERNFCVIFLAIISTLFLIGVSVLFFGLESWELFLTETVSYQQLVTHKWEGLFLRMMPNWFGSLRAMDIVSTQAFQIHFIIVFGVFCLTIYGFLKSEKALFSSVLLCAATFVLLPYAFTYDLGALLVFQIILLLTEKDGIGLNGSAKSEGLKILYLLLSSAIFALPLATPFYFLPYDKVITFEKFMFLVPPMVLTSYFAFIFFKFLPIYRKNR